MIIKIKTYLNSIYYIVIMFILSIFTSGVNAEIKIIAKRGDTLFKISREYEVPLKVLMYKNNFKDATKIIEGEVILIPIKNNNQHKSDKDHLTYKVIEGDTLYKISREYKVKLKDIIALNNLGNNLSLSINQIILLPEEAREIKDISRVNTKLASKKIGYHLTSKIEDISNIASLHRITIEEINTLNKLNNLTKINPNIKLRIRENKVSKWRNYDSIFVNWSEWTYFDGSYISKAKTKKNSPFYIAINCKKRTLNNTLNNPSWTNWYFPETDFEFKLINDFCDEEFNF